MNTKFFFRIFSSWNSATPNKRGNWRWSESPEKEICAKTSHKITNEEEASKQTDLIVLLSSSEDEGKETSGNNSKGCSSDLKNIKKATQSKRQRKPNRSKADTISIVPSSSNTYFEEDGEIRTRLEDTPRRSRSPRREEKSYRTHKEDSSYRHKHKKRRSPEGRRHKSSPRSSSSHSKGSHSPHSRRSYKSSRKDR